MQDITDDSLSNSEDPVALESPILDRLAEINADSALYTKGLRNLKAELEAKFDLENS